MGRAIIRCSLSGDAGSPARNAIVEVLEAAGFDSIGTFSYEVREISEAAALAALANVLAQLQNLPQGVSLNHVWIYVDQAD